MDLTPTGEDIRSSYVEIHIPSITQSIDTLSIEDVNFPTALQSEEESTMGDSSISINIARDTNAPNTTCLPITIHTDKQNNDTKAHHTKEDQHSSVNCSNCFKIAAEKKVLQEENQEFKDEISRLKAELRHSKNLLKSRLGQEGIVTTPPFTPIASPLSLGGRMSSSLQMMMNELDYKSVFEAAPNPYLILCADPPTFTCVGVTDLYLQATLKKREEVVGKGLFQVFPDNPADDSSSGEGNLRLSLMRVLATKKVDTMPVQKYDVEDPNNPGVYVSKYWTPINIPVWTKTGRMYILHRVEDVTEFMELKQQGQDHARAETMQHIRRVEESQARYHRLTTLLPLGIFHTDEKGELTYVNQPWERMTGVHWEDVCEERKKWYDCLPPKRDYNVGERWREQISSRAMFQVEYHVVNPEGWFLVQLVPEVSKADVVKGYLGYIIDVTERKLSEEAQRKRAEQLAELDRTKTVFFSNISHELRTPLTLILGPAEDSLGESGRQALPPRQRERMEVIQRSAQRLLKLVNSSLDFTRLEEGRLSSDFEPTDLASFTDVLAKLFRPAMETAGLAFQIEVKPLPEPVYVDRDLWQKIVFNLLSNALKYTLSGVVTLILQHDASNACLVVQDTGIGIPASELPNMFQRFHRVANLDGRSHEGAGIGLSLTQELVKLHGGTISIVSELGKGSAFTVTIPFGTTHLPQHMIKETPVGCTQVNSSAQLFVKEALNWTQPNEPSHVTEATGHMTPSSPPEMSNAITIPGFNIGSPAGSISSPEGSTSSHHERSLSSREHSLSSRSRSVSPRSRGEHFKILVADDNIDMRKLLYDLLSTQFTVQVVEDGEAAREATKHGKFDLLVSDIMMPKMDGFQLIKSLRSDEKTRTLPVILLSARVDEESRLRGLQLGADDFIVKPFSKRELLERVSGRLRAGRWRHQLTQELHDFQDESTRQKRLLQLVSHELRNPLVGIKGNSEIVESLLESIENALVARDEKDPVLPKLSESRAAIRVVLQCTDYQKIICDDVLDMAKIKEQKMELHLTSFDPSQIVTDAVQMLSVRAQQGEIKLSAECKMKRRIVSGDATRITQVLVNLISNAIKFTPKQGSIVVTLQSPSETTEKIELQFIVEDTGMGMSAEQQSRIFSPFTQASSAIHSQFGGTGLGLAISKSLVELMGGQISVTSALGKGSKFTATVFCGNVFVSVPSPPVVPKQLQRKFQVLVVDDTIINQKILKRMLEIAGHQCVVANNGQEGVNLWTQMGKVDAILMDLNMPIMGGLEATQCIRQAERLKPDSVPSWIIGLSGDNADTVAWREAGMNDYVVKPYNQKALLDKIAQAGSR